jgi:beta-phosphoglucomutase-like phosphatase (HAD superfamily)
MARREEIEYVLETIDLRDCFSVIVSAEDVSTCKPNPECYHTGFNLIDAARIRRGSNPMVHSECLVIEDAPQGIIAGKHAGLKTLGITNTVSAEKLREAGADAVSKSLADSQSVCLSEKLKVKLKVKNQNQSIFHFSLIKNARTSNTNRRSQK